MTNGGMPPTGGQGIDPIQSYNPNAAEQNQSEPTQSNQQPQKEFNINKNNGNNQGQETEGKEKKKDDGQAVAEGKVEAKQGEVSGKKDDVKTGKTEEIGATAKASQMRQVAKALLNMVDKLSHGEGITKMELKTTDKVPESFKGTQVTIDTDSSKIGFQNFKTESAMLDAHRTISQNPEELQQLADQLYDRGFRGTQFELSHGELSLSITLPQAQQAAPTPMQASSEQNYQREGGGQQGGGQSRQGDQGGGPDEE